MDVSRHCDVGPHDIRVIALPTSGRLRHPQRPRHRKARARIATLGRLRASMQAGSGAVDGAPSLGWTGNSYGEHGGWQVARQHVA